MQRKLIALYGLAHRNGLLASGLGAWLYEAAYGLYKSHLEAGPIRRLRRFVPTDHWAVDVGAHIGFFTLPFSRWVSGQGRVLACEPETENMARLLARLRRHKAVARVDLVAAALGRHDGTAHLEVNPSHSGDHRIGARGTVVAMRRLDSLLEERGWPKVGLVKIDVQGYEHEVIEGSYGLLTRAKPALIVEFDDGALRRAGSSSRQLIDHLWAIGYASFGPLGGRHWRARDRAEAQEEAGRFSATYLDLLFLQRTPD